MQKRYVISMQQNQRKETMWMKNTHHSESIERARSLIILWLQVHTKRETLKEYSTQEKNVYTIFDPLTTM